MLNILKKKEPETHKLTFKAINDFEAATPEQIEESAENCTSWAEINSRLNSLMRFQQGLKPLAGQVPEDVMVRRRDLENKCQILRNRLNEIEAQQGRDKKAADERYAAETWKREQPNFRYAYGSMVNTMHRLGLSQVPISSVQWQKCDENGIVEITTASHRSVKIDFKRLPASYWKTLTEQRFSPVIIPVEGTSKLVDGKREPLLHDGRFHGDSRIVTIPTFVAVMLT
jgi:hypothetical protein